MKKQTSDPAVPAGFPQTLPEFLGTVPGQEELKRAFRGAVDPRARKLLGEWQALYARFGSLPVGQDL